MKKQLLNINVPKVPKPTFDDFKGFNEKFSVIHDFITRLLIIGALVASFYFFLKEMTSNKYVLTSIEVAKSIEGNKGMYAGDLKQKIVMDMKEIMKKAENATHCTSNIANTVSSEAIPLNFAGLDLNQMFLYLRNFLKMQNREIRVYLMESEENSTRIKVLLSVGNETQTIHTFSTKDSVTTFLAENILKYNAPHNMGLYLIDKLQNDSTRNREIDEIVNFLSKLQEGEIWWEKLFQNNNWERKKFHLKAMKSYSNKDYINAKRNYDSIPNFEKYPEILLEIAQTYNQINADCQSKLDSLETVNRMLKSYIPKIDSLIVEADSLEKIRQITDLKCLTDVKKKCLSDSTSNWKEMSTLDSTINANISQTLEFCSKATAPNRKKYLEEDEDKRIQRESLKSRSLMILADAFGINKKYKDSEDKLIQAIKALSKYDIESNAAIYNWAANIKLSHLKINDSTVVCDSILKKSEYYISKAISLDKNNGNYYDTYAEILLKKGDVKGFYAKIDSALSYPNISKKITVFDYKQDSRWALFQKDANFSEILEKHRHNEKQVSVDKGSDPVAKSN